MNTHTHEVERLRLAFSCLSNQFLPLQSNQRQFSRSCFQSSQIWDAASCELPRRETRQVVDHLAQCHLCAGSWRLAQSIQADLKALGGGVSRPATAGWRGLVAVAALVLLAVGLFLLNPPDLWNHPDPVHLRGQERNAIRFSASEEDPLPRSQFRLSWSSNGAAAEVRYNLQVMTLDLKLVASARELTVAEYTVPARLLSGLPSGSLLVWRIEALYPDGRRRAGQFVSSLQ